MRISLYQPLVIQEIGKRPNQEDHVFPASPSIADKIFILCDGMGGHAKGEVASRIVAEETARPLNHLPLERMVLTDAMFDQAFEHACEHLDQVGEHDEDGRQMGTTLAFLGFHKAGALVAHIGDSRIYHIRPSERRMLYKSKDHSLVCELYEAGELTFSEMSTSPQRNVITRAVMPGTDNRVNADVVHVKDVKAGDYFFLCSDGMLERMADDELVDIFSSQVSDEEKRLQLMDATADNKDNHSAVIVHVEDVEAEDGDDRYADDEASSPCNALLLRRDDDDDEGTITIVDDVDDDAITAYTPVPNPGHAAIGEKHEPKEQQNVKHGCCDSPFKTWLVALVVAALVAAIVAAVYNYV